MARTSPGKLDITANRQTVRVMPETTPPNPAESGLEVRTQFVRNSSQPDEIIRIRYDSHANPMAMGIIPSPRPRYPHAPDPFPGSPMGYVPDPPMWR